MSQDYLTCVVSEKRECKVSPCEKEVFIIGPGSHEYKGDIEKIKQIIKNFGFEPYFALLSEQEKGLDSFCDKICSKIRSDFFCIALLNDPISCKCDGPKPIKVVRASRPNVYYEYGLAVAFGKKVIPIIRADLELPFDIQHIDAILYKDLEELGSKLTASINASLVKGIKQRAVARVPKVGLLLIGKDGKATTTVIAEPIIEVKKTGGATAQPPLPTGLLTQWNNPFDKKTVDRDLVPIAIKLWNEGDKPADNVVVFLEFPDSCELFEQYEVEGGLDIAALQTQPTFGGLYTQGNKTAKAWLDHLGNDREKSDFEKIYVNFNTVKDVILEVKGEVIQDNFPKKEFMFKIIVKPKIEKDV